MWQKTVFAIAVILASGCAHRHDPIIDPAGVDMGRYQQDLAECRQLASQVEGQAAEGALGGAVVGGLIGAVTGNQRSIERAAGVGAVLGSAKGGTASREERELVIKNCLRNRGYDVLN